MTPSALHPSLPRALVIAIAIAIGIVSIIVDHQVLSPSPRLAPERSHTLDPSHPLDPAHLRALPEVDTSAPEPFPDPPSPPHEAAPLSSTSGDGS